MIHTCCPACRLRFAASPTDRFPCPICGEETVGIDAGNAMGFRRHRVDPPTTVAVAVAVALQPPGTVPQAPR